MGNNRIGMMQTKTWSVIEACCNTGSGFILALLFTWAWQAWVAPISGADGVTAYVTMMTVVSVARSYVWRRVFNWWHHYRRFDKIIKQPSSGAVGCSYCGAPPHGKCRLTEKNAVCVQEFKTAFNQVSGGYGR